MSSASDIDRTFLSKSLGDRYEILEFDVTSGSKPGDNFLSVIYSASVTLRDTVTQETKLRHFILKCYPSHPGRQEYNNNTNIFYRELEIYKTWLPELITFQKDVLEINEAEVIKPPYPLFITGKATDYSKTTQPANKDSCNVSNPLDNFIMMEDLRKTWGFTMTDRRSSFDLDHIQLVIPALARQHALSWGYKHHVASNVLGKFPFLKNPFKEEDIMIWIQMMDTNFDQMSAIILEENVEDKYKLSEGLQQFKPKMRNVLQAYMGQEDITVYSDALRVKLDPAKLESIKDPWDVVLHGDCWSNNMLFRYDSTTGRPVEVILVDLQMVMEGCPTMDLTYVLYASCRSELRRTHLPSLFQLYVDTFTDVCAKLRCPTLPGLSLETLTARFQRTMPQAVITGSMLLPIMLKDEDNTVNLEEMDPTKDIAELMETAMIKGNNHNAAYRERVVELVQEVYDLGVI